MTDIPHRRRADFRLLRAVPTRWMDNDHYGHVNNDNTVAVRSD